MNREILDHPNENKENERKILLTFKAPIFQTFGVPFP